MRRQEYTQLEGALTIIPEVESNITETIASTNGCGVAACRKVAEVVETNSQVAIFTTQGESGICDGYCYQLSFSYGSSSRNQI